MSAIDKGLNALESAAGVVDKAIGFVSPTWAVARNKSRSMLAAYEATKPNRLRKTQKESRGPDAVMFGAGASLRDQARHLDENHDLVTGIPGPYTHLTLPTNREEADPVATSA